MGREDREKKVSVVPGIASAAKQSSIEQTGERVAALTGALAGAAALALAENVQASTPFDDAVNPIDSLGEHHSSGAQLTPGPMPDRFDMIFVTAPPGQGYDFYRAQFKAEAGPDNGVVFTRMGPVSPIDEINTPFTTEGTAVEISRPDGRMDMLRVPGINPASGLPSGEIDRNGESVWPTGSNSSVGFIHPSAQNLGNVKIVTNLPVPMWLGAEDEDVWQCSIREDNFYQTLRDSIDEAAAAGMDPCQADILNCNAESTILDDIRAPETPEFAVVHRVDPPNAVLHFPPETHMLGWNPGTGEYDKYMEKGPDGCFTVETEPPYSPDIIPSPETGMGLPSALLTKPLNIEGRHIYPYVGEYDLNPTLNYRPRLEAKAFEVKPDGTICEVAVTMAVDETAVVDDDHDGIPNRYDNCQWVQESAAVDMSGPMGISDGIGDACQTSCTNWPVVNPPAGSGPADFWPCDSTEITGYDHAYKRGDGSTMLANHELQRNDDGSVAMPAGGDLYWMHAQAAQHEGAEVASPVFRFPAGNSADVEILSRDHPNGMPGEATFTHYPYPSGEPVVTSLSVGVHHFDPGLGGELGVEGSVIRIHAGTENLPMPTPTPTPTSTPSDSPTPTPSDTPTPTPSDSATPTPEPTPSDSAEPTPSASPSDTPQPTPSDSAEPTPTDSAMPSDSPEPTPTPETPEASATPVATTPHPTPPDSPTPPDPTGPMPTGMDMENGSTHSGASCAMVGQLDRPEAGGALDFTTTMMVGAPMVFVLASRYAARFRAFLGNLLKPFNPKDEYWRKK